VNRFIEIIKYTWKAKGRHGIHSPFVYDLVDICFKIAVHRNNISKLSSRTTVHSSALSCLMQLSKHLKYTKIIAGSGVQMDIEELVKHQNGEANILNLSYFEKLEKETSPSVILLTVDASKDNLLNCVVPLLPLLDEHSILLVDGIRTSDSVYSDWKHILLNTELHFSADLYQFGLLAKRSFQEKEHFVLRY
jgi:hypothetical protein